MSSEVAEHRLESICLLVVDCPHATPKWTDSGVVVLRNQNIKGGRLDLSSPSYTDEEHYLGRVKRAVPQAGDIVITREAPMGDVCQIPAGLKCCLGQRQVLLRPDPTKVSSRYLLYALQSPYLQHQIGWNEGTGSTVSNLRIPVLEALKVPMPCMATQQVIADVLGALDDRITLLRETNATLESIAQALFKSWFVDFDPVRAKMDGRVPEGMDEATLALFPDSFEESELGLVPRGWRIGSLGSELKIAYGKNLPTNKLLASGYPVYGGNGQIGYFDKYIYETRQVLIACRGAASGKVNQSARKAFVTNNSLVLESDESTNLPFGYIKGYMLNSDLTAFVTGSAQPQVTIDNLKVFKLLVPCASVLRAFESLSSVFENRIEENDRQISCLAELRDALLPRLISGQLRLPELEEIVTEAS
ncbi:MAG: restriction endonuclease subunit S [Fluviibacter sp.]